MRGHCTSGNAIRFDNGSFFPVPFQFISYIFSLHKMNQFEILVEAYEHQNMNYLLTLAVNTVY